MNSRTLLAIAFTGFACLFQTLNVRAQAPEFVFRSKSDFNGPNPSYTTRISSWTNTYNTTSGAFSGSFREYSGSLGTDSITFHMESYLTGDGTFNGSSPNMGGTQQVSVFVRDGGTVTVDVAGSGTASVDGSALYGHNAFASYPPSGSAIAEVLSGYGTDSDSGSGSTTTKYQLSCTPATVTFPEWPGVQYVEVTATSAFGADADASNWFNGTNTAYQTATVTAERGDDDPIIIADGPYVSGVLKDPVDLGDTVSFTNDAYDPDDSTAPLDGICEVLWTVIDPAGTSSTSSNPSGHSFAASLPGYYTVMLHVTDNEGDTSSAEFAFMAGPEKVAQNDRNGGGDNYTCSGAAAGAENANRADEATAMSSYPRRRGRTNFGSGETIYTDPDPVMTRGYPLKLDLHYRTQWRENQPDVGVGNFTHSYALRVFTGLNSLSQTTWWVQDGDGSQHLMGVGATPASGKEDGVFSTLVDTGSGYRLEDAGAPGSIDSYGNFTYYFDASGKLSSVEDSNGNTQTLTYNGNGDLTKVEDDNTGKEITFEYDTVGQVARIVENNGAAVKHLTYNWIDQITKIELKDSSSTVIRYTDLDYFTSSDWEDEDLVKKITFDGDSQTAIDFSYYRWDEFLWLANHTTTKGSTNYTYSETPPAGMLFRVKQTNAKGGAYYYDFNSDGDMEDVWGPTFYQASTSLKHTYTYSLDRKIASFSDGTASYTYTYHSNGLLDRVTDGTGAYRDYTYSGANLIRVDTNSGTKLKLYYDNSSFPNVPTRYEDGNGDIWTVTLNSYGQPLSVAPPTGAELGTTSFSYDEVSSSPTFGYLKDITNGAGDVIDFDSYSDLGDVTSITVEPVSGTTVTEQYEYDAAQRLTKITHDDSTTKLYSYSGRDLSQITDESSTAVNYSWCKGCGALDGVSGPLSWGLSWTRDNDRDVTTYTDAHSYDTDYVYGTGGELKEIDYPDPNPYSSYQKFWYERSGRVRKLLRTLSGMDVEYTYDAAGRIKTIKPNHLTVSFYYDSEGRLDYISDEAGVHAYRYDSASLVEKDIYNASAMGVTNLQNFEYEYYPDQLLKKVTWKDGTTTVASWEYEYDGAGRLTRITNGFSEVTDFTYDDAGKLTSQVNDNGTSTEITYNHSRAWPTEILHKDGSTTFEEFDITYDSGSPTVGLITKVDEYDGSAITYGYDALYRLTSETRTGTQAYSQTLGYDLAGNITTKNGSAFATYNEANEVTSHTLGTIGVDLNGNHGNINYTGGGGNVAHWTNGFNYVKKHVQGSNERYFKYDYDGTLRYIEDFGGDKRQLFYVGGKLVAEMLNGVPYKAYTWGPNGVVSQRVLTGTPESHWYHLGPQGETRHLTDDTGTTVASYYYNAYGERLSVSGSIDNPFQYGARFGYYQLEGYHDNIRVGNRLYEPKMMRWNIRDRIRYAGGDNLYAYVLGNPVRYYDIGGNQVGEIHEPGAGEGVYECRRPNEIPFLENFGDHAWIVSPSFPGGVGMGPRDPESWNQFPAEATNHGDEDFGPGSGTTCEARNNVSDECLSEKVTIGDDLGIFIPFLNDCRGFVADLIEKCDTL